MKLTETAMKNYQLLFANHSSRLDDTDPEFLKIFVQKWPFAHFLPTFCPLLKSQKT